MVVVSKRCCILTENKAFYLNETCTRRYRKHIKSYFTWLNISKTRAVCTMCSNFRLKTSLSSLYTWRMPNVYNFSFTQKLPKVRVHALSWASLMNLGRLSNGICRYISGFTSPAMLQSKGELLTLLNYLLHKSGFCLDRE